MPELVLRQPVKMPARHIASRIWPVLLVLLGAVGLWGVLWAGMFHRQASILNPGSLRNQEVRQQAQAPVTTENKTVEIKDHSLGTDGKTEQGAAVKTEHSAEIKSEQSTDIKTKQSAVGKIGQSADGSDWQKMSKEEKKHVCDLALDHTTLKKASDQKLEIRRRRLLEYLDTVYQDPSERQVSIADKIATYISDMKAEQAKKKAGRVKKKGGRGTER